MSDVIHLIEIDNPLDMGSKRERRELPFDPNKTVLEYLDGPRSSDFIASINGEIVMDEEIKRRVPQPGDYIVIAPRLRGGGNDDKMIARIIVMIIIIVASQGAGAAAANAAGFGSAAGWSMAIASAAMLALNALVPMTDGMSQPDSSPTYGIDGAKNTSKEGVPVPLTYGNMRYGGNLIGTYTVTDSQSNQVLYMMINCGEGPVGQPMDWRINDQKPEDVGATIEFRDGSDSVNLATSVPYFAESKTPFSLSYRLTPDWYYFTTNGEIDRVRMDFAAPVGLYRTSSEGNTFPVDVDIEVQYRIAGSNAAFAPLPTDSKRIGGEVTYVPCRLRRVIAGNDYQGNQRYEYKDYVIDGTEGHDKATLLNSPGELGSDVLVKALTDGWENADRAKGDTTGLPVVAYARAAELGEGPMGFEMLAEKKTVYRKSLESRPLPEAVYEFRVRRTSEEEYKTRPDKVSDVVMLTDVVEITTEDVRYRNTAIAIVRVPLGEEISGLPTVTHITGGKIIRVWNKTSSAWEWRPSNNPAWVALDILTNSRYAGYASMSRIILDQWIEWADYCTSQKLSFNGVFDVQTNVWDATMKVMRCGHAQLVRVGTRYGVAIERAEPVSMMFNNSNIIKDTFQESWTSVDDRANVLEGTYVDAKAGYKERSLRIFDKDAIAAGKPEKIAQLDLFGVTDEAQALKDLRLMLYYNRYIRTAIKFDAPIEAIGCTVGNVIAVQHDMPQWGYGGRTDAGSGTATIKLDRPVRMEAGKTYQLLLHFPALQRYSGNVTFVATVGGEVSLTLSGMDSVFQTLHRIVIGGVDRPVLRTFESGGDYGVVLQDVDAAGVTVGSAYQLWQTDVIETRNLNNTAPAGGDVEVTSVVATSAFSAAPVQFTSWMFGETNKTSKQFRVKKISGTGEYVRTLECVEYNATVYTNNPRDSTVISDLPTGVDHVEIDGVTESQFRNGTYFENRVTVHFHSEQAGYAFSKVWYALDGSSTWQPAPDGFTESTIVLAKGKRVKFKVLAYNALAKSAAAGTAPISAEYTVLGRTTGTAPVTGVSAAFVDTGILVKWDEYPDPELWQLTTVKLGGTSWETGVIQRSGKITQFTMPFKPAGNYTLRFKHRSSMGEGDELVYGLTVNAPNPPSVISVQSVGLAVTPRWLSGKSHQKIARYELRAGDAASTWDTATPVAETDGNTLTTTFHSLSTWSKIFVRAIDAAGSFNTASATYTASVVVGDPGNDALGYVEEGWAPGKVGGAADLVFFMNATSATGADNGEIFITGTKFVHPDGVARTSGLGGYVYTRYGEGETGKFYLMYSDTPVATRFSSVARGSAGNIIAVRKKDGVWEAIGNTVAVQAFTPEATDCIIAAVEARASTGGLTALYIHVSGSAGVDGVDGSNGSDGGYIDHVFRRSATAPAAPTGNGTPASWFDAPPSGTDPLWMSTGYKTAADVLVGVWGTPVRLDADGVFVEYSVNGTSGWHSTYAAGDKYMRQKVGVNGTWSAAIKIVGEDGSPGNPGSPGQRGSVNVSRPIAGTSWSNTEAQAALTAGGYGSPIYGDVVTLYNTAAAFSETRAWNGAAWIVLTQYLHGNMFIDGTILAQKVDTRGLEIKDAAGNVIFGANTPLSAQYINALFGGSNMLPNSSFEKASTTAGVPEFYTGVSFGAGITITSALIAVDGYREHGAYSHRMQVTGITSPATNVHQRFSDHVDVRAGRPYTASIFCRTSASSYYLRLGIRWYDSDGAAISTDYQEWQASNVMRRFIMSPKTAPASAVTARVMFGIRRPSAADTTLGTHWYDAVQLEEGEVATAYAVSRKDGVSLDNPITSDNITTYMEGAAIGTAQIGQLTAANLTVTALSDTVNGGASSGGRVVIESNKISVFDTTNALRVKMGYLL